MPSTILSAPATPSEPAADTVRVAAPAKLNLYLHVLGRRPDGYHLLDSLVAFAGIHDILSVRPADGFSLEITGPFAALLLAEDPAGNLVARAARGLAAALGRDPHVAITLDKRLPVAGGIGGGSADAAATLRALALLWGLAADDPRPLQVAPTLGADVPVCLFGRTAYFAGAGEVVEPAPALPADLAVLLVNPGVGLNTRAVFQARQGGWRAAGRLERAPRDGADLTAMLRERHNDLMPPALALAPVVGEVVDALAAAPGCRLARMSGSGATCFGLFASLAEAEAAAGRLGAEHPGWWVAAAPFVADVHRLTV
ncbi:4-(cytidine 5'-diphospho)-2-C-methyl-D-erythritol kinase [Oleisolibacter albus]|uniref:4-(cytidine 5'-diphospho)-2-C-methyl-D-erythritol kinase n=1 Tax=Oleisolibacter albus TaxID=2171757 RepID=UPI000DF2A936